MTRALYRNQLETLRDLTEALVAACPGVRTAPNPTRSTP